MGQCCLGSNGEENFILEEFWERIKLRKVSQKTFQEFIILRVNNFTIPEKQFNRIIEEFLLTNNPNIDSHYKSYWKDVFVNCQVQDTILELVISLLILCKKDKEDFKKNLEHILSSIYSSKKTNNRNKIFNILRFYLYLITTSSVQALQDMKMCDEKTSQYINDTFDTKILEKYINQILLNNVNNDVDIFLYFNKWYDNLGNDSQVRREISEFNEISRKKVK